jgi:hypothetical protein
MLIPLIAFVHCSSPGGGQPDAGGDSVPAGTCKAPTGPGVQHKDAITADETWKAADGPHTITFDIKVNKGATLTIEPCAEVRIKKGFTLVVEGNLVAQGTAASPIQFVADDPAEPWGYMQVFAPGTIKLAYATLSDAGGQGVTNSYAALEARGDQLLPAQEILKVDNVSVIGSRTFGVSLRAGGAFTKDSQALTITKSAMPPMRINPRLASNVPTGIYAGNSDDAIYVACEAYGDVNNEDVTYHARGVPYHIGTSDTSGRFIVGPKHFTLTLEAGVIFKFMKGSSANSLLGAVDGADSTGVIVANGTTAQPVVLTSAEATPAAGDWIGVQFGKVVDAGFKLDHVEIRFAGGASLASGAHCKPNTDAQSANEDAALAIYHQPAGQYLTNSVIADSKVDGVDNAFAGTYFDFKPTNTFTNVPGCQVTYPRPTTGICPVKPCP